MASSGTIKEISTCPKTPNCVSSLTDSKKHFMDPWENSGEDVLKRIKKAAFTEPRSKLISESPTHLHFTFKSFVFRFVDDVWFAVEGDKVHFKAAARLGRKDFDMNKKRMNRIKGKVYR